MAVYINTVGITAARLLANIKAEIKANTIKTWKFNPSTGFVHDTKNGEWNKGAYLQIQESNNPLELILYYKIVKGSTIPTGTYGVVNGRFSEMIMNHFKGNYENIILKDIR